ncbi:DUF4178 domain-containing protein [Thermomonospora cellulosilytica]|uniref:DUF4178 domain-containing protein n=1 Tax=Thermomonospora cellulosilytica TaxID=1411118 RepID=A0A7W3R8Z5_9ACTN|nr:DUF4178 domain-containing protein [Thermomonospora cellulosilytica]MBA9003840.1 hypothetical protein [Thermomonospora cellulosilytica]
MQAAVIALLALILVALVVLIVVLVRRSKERPQQEPARPADPFASVGEVAGDPRSLKAGDLVEYLGTRYFVRGSVRFREGGYTWSEHLLDADTAEGAKVWISVEEDPDLEVVWWTERDVGDLRPDRPTLTLDGVEYRREEHGTAEYRTEGTTGLGTGGRVEYADYEGPGGRYLSFERFDGGAWEAGTGERVPTGTMTIYPGS